MTSLSSQIPTVSVIMPVYNRQASVSAAIQSILCQTMPDFELIIIDDASTDETPGILAAAEAADPRVRLVHNETNLGVAQSLNRGLALAQGQFIARMDSDDLSAPDRLAVQLAYLANHPQVDVVGSQIYLRLQHLDGRCKPHHYPLRHSHMWAYCLFECPIAHPSLMFRRHLLDKGLFVYDPAYRHAEDLGLWMKLMPLVTFANVPNRLMTYCLRKDSITYQHQREQQAMTVALQCQLLSQLLGRPLTEAEQHFHHQLVFHQVPYSPAVLVTARQWLNQLRQANRLTRMFDDDGLVAILEKRWYDLCGRLTPLGLLVWAHYACSPYGRVYNIRTLKQSIHLAYHCLLAEGRKMVEALGIPLPRPLTEEA